MALILNPGYGQENLHIPLKKVLWAKRARWQEQVWFAGDTNRRDFLSKIELHLMALCDTKFIITHARPHWKPSKEDQA